MACMKAVLQAGVVFVTFGVLMAGVLQCVTLPTRELAPEDYRLKNVRYTDNKAQESAMVVCQVNDGGLTCIDLERAIQIISEEQEKREKELPKEDL